MVERAKPRRSPQQAEATASAHAFERLRETARGIFLEALSECSIPRAFERHVQHEGGALRVVDDLYDFSNFSNIVTVSFGKAAQAMTEALTATTGAGLKGVVVDAVEHTGQLSGFRYFQGGHPTPNAQSVQAARTILRQLKMQNSQSLVIYLISGGGSALVEAAIDDEMPLPDRSALGRRQVRPRQ